MLKDKVGNKLYRRVEVKVFFPQDVFPPKRFVSRAGPQQGFNTAGVDDLLMQVADRLEELYPWWNFQFVELKSHARVARFVFTFAGYNTDYKPVAQADLKDFTIPTKEGSTLVPETAESDVTEPAVKAAVGTTLSDVAKEASGI